LIYLSPELVAITSLSTVLVKRVIKSAPHSYPTDQIQVRTQITKSAIAYS